MNKEHLVQSGFAAQAKGSKMFDKFLCMILLCRIQGKITHEDLSYIIQMTTNKQLPLLAV
jgi:hypothetical protein